MEPSLTVYIQQPPPWLKGTKGVYLWQLLPEPPSHFTFLFSFVSVILKAEVCSRKVFVTYEKLEKMEAKINGLTLIKTSVAFLHSVECRQFSNFDLLLFLLVLIFLLLFCWILSYCLVLANALTTFIYIFLLHHFLKKWVGLMSWQKVRCSHPFP